MERLSLSARIRRGNGAQDMEQFEDLRWWSVSKLAERLSEVKEGSFTRSFIMAEFQRRQTKARLDSSRAIVGAAVAVIVAAIVQIMATLLA